MIESIVISAISILMFVYWFRGTVRLILDAKVDRRKLERVASEHGLLLSTASAALKSVPPSDVLAWLERDRKTLDRLIQPAKWRSLEMILLKVDYQAMRLCWRLGRLLAPKKANQCLCQMGRILDTLAASVEPSPKVYWRA